MKNRAAIQIIAILLLAFGALPTAQATGLVYKAMVKETASNKPASTATAFNLPDSATAPFRSFDTALASGDVVSYMANNNTDWEECIGTFTAGTPDTLSCDSLLDSSNGGSSVDFSSGGNVTVYLTNSAALIGQSDLSIRASVPGGRLTLSSGNPAYHPLNTVSVSGQDTTNDLITVTAHGWTVGTMVKSSATSGGLTAGTQYYVGNPTANTVSLHTTLAAALAGTSKVDITGAVTANITANGVANTSVYYTPYLHNLISLWDGYRWRPVEFAETTLALGTLTSDKPYDIYGYLSGGALTIEVLAWTSDTARATEITRQDGRYCKSGDKTRLFLGTLYTRDTTSTELSNSKIYLVNFYNRRNFGAEVREATATWAYSVTIIRQVNANSGNQIDFILPTDAYEVSYTSITRAINSTTTARFVYGGIGIDSTTAIYRLSANYFQVTSSVTQTQAISGRLLSVGKGKHYMSALEAGNGTDTQTWYGSSSYQGLLGVFEY